MYRISIHAPAKGATVLTVAVAAHIAISIHAPAKGATGDIPVSKVRPLFQSTLPRRERPLLSKAGGLLPLLFQSTLPRRERRLIAVNVMYNVHFNPRSREGSDIVSVLFSLGICISIHAPAKGATSSTSFSVSMVLFQSTLPRRERLANRSTAAAATTHFNPRSREGSDLLSYSHCDIP